MGSTATPTAARAWDPASPKTSPSRVLAPLITAGWAVNEGSEATYPVTFTTRVIRSRSPTSASIAARALRQQVAASSAACSWVTAPPTLPVSGSAPSTKGSCPEVCTWFPVATAGT